MHIWLFPLPSLQVAEPFWPNAIAQVREAHPDFSFMAEVNWDLEWTLQQQGFSYTYDKRLYDKDLLGDADYEREGNDLDERGLYLDEPAWKFLAFSMTRD